MGRSQPSPMPQQDSFHNNFQAVLTCGYYSVLSSRYAVRNWKLDFDKQKHIAGARQLMSTLSQVAGEAVSLEFCGICKDSYTKWKHHPRPQCDCDSEGAGACPIMCTSPTVLPALLLEHLQSKSSAQRLSEGKKLPTLKIRSRRKGKAEANKRMGISKKVIERVNQARTSNQSKMLFHWLRKGNNFKNSSTYGIRTSQVGAGSGSKDCIMGGNGQGGGCDSGHGGSDIGSNYIGGCRGVGVGGETGSGEDGSGDCVMDMSDSSAGGGGSGITHTRGTGNCGNSGVESGASVAPAAAVDHFTPNIDLNPVIVRSQSCHCCGYYP